MKKGLGQASTFMCWSCQFCSPSSPTSLPLFPFSCVFSPIVSPEAPILSTHSHSASPSPQGGLEGERTPPNIGVVQPPLCQALS